jgi:uncharacterized protein (TIGR02145 family)
VKNLKKGDIVSVTYTDRQEFTDGDCWNHKALESVKILSKGESFTDTRDGKTYKNVKIGEQVWMAENLDIKTGNSWCYGNDEANCKKYGRLYDWETAKKVCPSGWHLPSNEEWLNLINYVGGDNVAGKKLKSTRDWNDNGNGTDNHEFSALPSGYRNNLDGNFKLIGESSYWWSATEYDANDAYKWYMYNNLESFDGQNDHKSDGYSVRCVKD